jgi:imidazolonepropionase-like amidohydrolase
MTDHPVIEQKHTLIHAALFVKAGLPELEALKAVTINAAKTCYVDHLVGSIKEGKHADIVIWSKHPLDIMAEAETVILNGNIEK